MALDPLTNLDKDIETPQENMPIWKGAVSYPFMTHFWEMREHVGPRELCIKRGSCRPQQMGPQPREESLPQA